MKKIKKIMLGLGSVSILSIPLTTISCGKEEDNNQEQEIEYKTNDEKVFKLNDDKTVLLGVQDGIDKNDIKKILLTSNIKKIENNAFQDFKSLKKITLNEGLEEIGSYAFAKSGVKEINIPSTVEKISYQAFLSCKSLEKVTLNEGLKEIHQLAFAWSGIKEIIIPSTCELILSHAFTDCRSLETLTLKKGLKQIKVEAFKNTKLKQVTIPTSVTNTMEELKKAFPDSCVITKL